MSKGKKPRIKAAASLPIKTYTYQREGARMQATSIIQLVITLFPRQTVDGKGAEFVKSLLGLLLVRVVSCRLISSSSMPYVGDNGYLDERS